MSNALPAATVADYTAQLRSALSAFTRPDADALDWQAPAYVVWAWAELLTPADAALSAAERKVLKAALAVVAPAVKHEAPA